MNMIILLRIGEKMETKQKKLQFQKSYFIHYANKENVAS